jgi:hypothetical protein
VTTKYHVEFNVWVGVNASTPEEAYDIAKRTLEDAGVVSLIATDVQEVDY